MKKGYHPAKREKELKTVETLVNGLTEKQKAHRLECLKDGLNDDVCEKCKGIYLACFHFVSCTQTECPLKTGPSLLDMFVNAKSNAEKS